MQHSRPVLKDPERMIQSAVVENGADRVLRSTRAQITYSFTAYKDLYIWIMYIWLIAVPSGEAVVARR